MVLNLATRGDTHSLKIYVRQLASSCQSLHFIDIIDIQRNEDDFSDFNVPEKICSRWNAVIVGCRYRIENLVKISFSPLEIYLKTQKMFPSTTIPWKQVKAQWCASSLSPHYWLHGCVCFPVLHSAYMQGAIFYMQCAICMHLHLFSTKDSIQQKNSWLIEEQVHFEKKEIFICLKSNDVVRGESVKW